jgi:hypothetical protein
MFTQIKDSATVVHGQEKKRLKLMGIQMPDRKTIPEDNRHETRQVLSVDITHGRNPVNDERALHSPEPQGFHLRDEEESLRIPPRNIRINEEINGFEVIIAKNLIEF